MRSTRYRRSKQKAEESQHEYVSQSRLQEPTIWNCKGMTLKLRICTAGQSMKFAFSAGKYTSWNFLATARRPPPSVTVMNVKKSASPIPVVSPVHTYKLSG